MSRRIWLLRVCPSVILNAEKPGGWGRAFRIEMTDTIGYHSKSYDTGEGGIVWKELTRTSCRGRVGMAHWLDVAHPDMPGAQQVGVQTTDQISQPVELPPKLRWLQRLVVLSLLPSAGRYMVGFAHCRDCVQYHDAFFHHLEFYW